MKKERFTAVQAMRFFCCLVVALGHMGFFDVFPVLKNGSTIWVLVIFFLISGFTMVYSYNDRELDCTLTKNFKFAVGKIKKLYPLHVQTAVIQFVILFLLFFVLMKNFAMEAIARFLFRFGINLVLLQAWVPDRKNYIMNFNGPSWFLSVMLFAYFVFPWIIKLFKKWNSTRKLLILTGVLVVLSVVTTALLGIKIGYEEELPIWYQNYFPVTQTLLFFEGCVFGFIYLECKKKEPEEEKTVSAGKWTLIELLVIIYFFAGSVLVKQMSLGKLGDFCRGLSASYSFLPMLFCVPLIIVFILNRGGITKALCAKPILYLGDISMYIYLIHYIFANIVMIVEMITGAFPRPVKLVVIIIEMTLTILVSAAYNKLQKKKAKKVAINKGNT